MTTEYVGTGRPPSGVFDEARRILLCAIASLLIHVLAVASAAAEVVVGPRVDVGPIDDHVSAYLESAEALTLDDMLQKVAKDGFRPINTAVADFGYYTKGVWLRVPVRNASDEKVEQLLTLHTNFMRDIDVWFVDDAGVDHVLSQRVSSPFSTRPIAYHQLVAPLELRPAATGDIFIRYVSEGETVLPLSLLSPLGFARVTNSRVTIDFVFYGIMAMFVAASLVGRFFWRNPTFISYALYAGVVLLYIFQRDGYAFQYVWPNAPAANNFSSLPIGASLPLFAALFTRAYLNTNRLHPAIDRVLVAIVAAQCLVVASSALIGPSSAKKLAVLSTTLSVVIFFGIGVAAFRKYGRRSLFFLTGWLGILCASLIMMFVHWSGLDVSRAQSLDIMRGAMVFDAFMLGLASLVSVVEVHRDREKLVHERMGAMQANIDLHDRLRRLEQKYHLAQTISERTNQRLVDATHDLRQPLYALRAALGDASRMQMREVKSKAVEESLTYMEGLVEAVLDEAMEQGEVAPPEASDGAEAVRVDKLFASLLTMFEADAAKNNVSITAVNSSHLVRSAPFPVLRILSNFVANAIQYAPGARIVIGARRMGERLSLEVHDSGPGMTTEELSAVKTRFARGETAAGDQNGVGLGLSIVEKLVAESGLDWRLDSKKGRGTVARLIAPLAKEQE